MDTKRIVAMMIDYWAKRGNVIRMMTTELVPRSHVRDAWNAIHGTELRTHTDALTAEQAERISECYDIEVYFGKHGLPRQRQPGTELKDLLRPATQLEYDEVGAVVEGMQPGDVLFIEKYGFLRQPTFVMPPGSVERARGQLEQERKEYSITAWMYASRLAGLKGVPTVYADHDAFEQDTIRTLCGKDARELVCSPANEKEYILGLRMQPGRARRACAIIKDWALDYLPPNGTLPGERKAKLVLLFGDQQHPEDLQQAFGNIGLQAKFTFMKTRGLRERAAEQIRHEANAKGRDLPPFIASMLGGAVVRQASEQ